MTSTHQPRRKLTYADYCAIPEDLLRHEILDGEHVVSPSPNVPHQSAATRLTAILLPQIEGQDLGRVLAAPLDVELSPFDIAQPDVIAIATARSEIITHTRILGAPDLVIEVLSPGTARRDRGLKATRYALAGVREYWLVDVEAHRIEQFELAGDRFVLRQTATTTLASWAFPSVTVDLGALWP